MRLWDNSDYLMLTLLACSYLHRIVITEIFAPGPLIMSETGLTSEAEFLYLGHRYFAVLSNTPATQVDFLKFPTSSQLLNI